MKKLFVIVLVLPVTTFIVWRFLVLMIPADEHRYVRLDTTVSANSSWKGSERRIGSFKHDAEVCAGGVCRTKLKTRRRKKYYGLSIAGDQFFLNGKPFRILGGSFHYFRTQPHQWIDRLEKLKAAGLNTVTTCIPWNLHERVPGKYRFSGRWKLLAFIKLIRKMGLHVIVQLGPYVSAEWELGGLPAWLLHDPDMKVRTSKYPPFLQHVEHYFDQLLPLLTEHTYSNHGPIIGFQVEDEFGNYGPDDAYMEFLVGMLTKHGLKEMYFTSADAFSPERFQRGFRTDVLATINVNDNSLQPLGRLKTLQPDKPLMVMEFSSGRFDTWGQNHSTTSGTEFFKTVDALLSMNASINFHMFIGGTNFEFWNGASFGGAHMRQFMPTTTSYDYDALVSESGNCHPTKYKALRMLLTKHKLVSTPLPHFPHNTSKGAYDSVPIKDVIRMDEFVKLSHIKPTWLSRPIFMEYLNISNHGGQTFGWILYRASYDFGNKISIDGVVHNRAHIFLNGHLVRLIYNQRMTNISENILVDFKYMKDKGNVLEILVENMGRVSNRMLDVQRRGFEGNVTVGGKLLSTWEHVSLDFSVEFIASVAKNAHWMPYSEQHYPSFYRGQFNVRHLHDTFLDMRRWTKGIAVVNGYNVGRYWNVGPQQTLYIPKPLLKKARNEIIIFELEKPGSKLEFLAEAVLNSVTTLPST